MGSIEGVLRAAWKDTQQAGEQPRANWLMSETWELEATRFNVLSVKILKPVSSPARQRVRRTPASRSRQDMAWDAINWQTDCGAAWMDKRPRHWEKAGIKPRPRRPALPPAHSPGRSCYQDPAPRPSQPSAPYRPAPCPPQAPAAAVRPAAVPAWPVPLPA